MDPSEEDPQEEDEPQEEDAPTPKKIKNADAVIMSAHESSNAATGRFDIQGKCKLADGSIRTIGILGFCSQELFWGTGMEGVAQEHQ